MPYAWDNEMRAAPEGSGAASSAARARLRLWPHRSMTNGGFAFFVAASFALICLPLLSVLGSPVMWALMPFAMGTLALTVGMIRLNDRRLQMSEELVLSEDRVALTRREARGRERHWEANPHWVRVSLREEDGPVPNYVTLRGGDREVEIGAFLSPEERAALYEDLSRRLGPRA